MATKLLSFARVAAVIGIVAAAAIPVADARVGGGASSGSRGSRTFSAPSSTVTSPRGAQPMQRTETPSTATQGGFGSAAAQGGRRFGFGTGMMAGLLGAGLLGMMFGGGLFGGLSGLGSMFGLLLQIMLIGGLAWMALRFFRRRSEPALAGAGAPYARSTHDDVLQTGSSSTAATSRAPIQIEASDYAAFERALVEAQDAYGREDSHRLASISTAEMTRYFQADLDENRRRGVRNEVSDAKLLQGDLSEAWREGSVDYATVAMRFTTRDVFVDRTTGQVVSGHPGVTQEAVELWTFRRGGGSSGWMISAIQQTG